MTRITRAVWSGRILCCLAILLSSLLLPSPVLAGTIRIQNNSIIQNFPELITFHLAASSPSNLTQVVLIYRIKSDSCLPGETRQVFDFPPDQSITLSWDWSLDAYGALPPGVQVDWQWELHDADGTVMFSEPQTFRLEDRHFTWKMLESADLTLYWAKGGADFGQQLLDISNKSLDRIEESMGVRVTGPIQLIVYPSAQDMRDALVSVNDWAGGVAFPDYRVVLIGLDPGSLDWAQQAIPHELAHLITAIRIANCQGGYLPTWLNEGLSEYAQGPVTSQASSRVITALAQSNLPPFTGLAHGFAADSQQADLNYDQSWMFTSFLIESFGTDKLNRLLDGIRSGQPVDQTLLAVYGADTDLLDLTWRASLGYNGTPTEALLPTLAPTQEISASMGSGDLSAAPAVQDPAGDAVSQSPTAVSQSTLPPETVQFNSKISVTPPAPEPDLLSMIVRLLSLGGLAALILVCIGIAAAVLLRTLKDI